MNLSPQEIELLETLPIAEREMVLAELFGSPATNVAGGSNSYERHKEQTRKRQLKQTADGQDIGSLPWQNVDWESRLRAKESLEFFAKHYIPKTFCLPWAQYHLEMIAGIEATAKYNDWQAIGVPRAGGKALALDTKIPTPTGWTTMGEIRVGDTVYDARGISTSVVAKSGVQQRRSYSLEFSNGAIVHACAEHQWAATLGGKRQVFTTQQIYDGGRLPYSFDGPEWITLADGKTKLFPIDNTGVSISDIAEINPEPMQCIQVDSPDSTYLITEHFIPTHNSKLCIAGVVWGLLNAWRFYAMLVGATATRGDKLLKNAYAQIKGNRLLRQDYPEVCFPFAALGGETRKATGQKCCGNRTALKVGASEIVFPTITIDPREVPEEYYSIVANEEGYARTSGSRMQSGGITGDLRGGSETTEALDERRPDWAVADDFQTRGSAKSQTQSHDRVQSVVADLGYLGGPDSPCSVIVPCTCMYVGDGADQLLDRDKHPEFNGIRRKMLSSMPSNTKLVNEYINLVHDIDRTVPRDERAEARNKFYLEHQAEIEEGAVATWPERFDSQKKKEVSAIQHAIHLMSVSMEAFYCEGQNDPQAMAAAGSIKLKPDQIRAKQHHLGRGIIPRWATELVIAADVQKDALFWIAVAASQDFQVAVIDYGAFPDQQRGYYRRDSLQSKLSDIYPSDVQETVIRRGVQNFAKSMSKRRWKVEGGRHRQLGLLVADARKWTATVGAALAASGARAMPYMGYGIGARNKPMIEWNRGDGETKGHHWHVGKTKVLSNQDVLKIDKYYWQSELHNGFALPWGEPGSISLFDSPEETHDLIADHLCSETDKLIENKWDKREVREWIQPPDAQNDFFDALMAALAALSKLGCRRPDVHLFEPEGDESSSDEAPVVMEWVEFD